MRTIFAEYNPKRNSIDVYTSVGYMLRIDCWEAEKNLKTTPGSDCALNALAIDEPLEYAKLYLDGNLHIQEVHQWRVRLMHSLILVWFLSSFQLPNSQCGAYSQQRCKHQYCCAWDCILQILFSSYQISLSLNQSFVEKIRSISISSPCHFYFVLYCFI